SFDDFEPVVLFILNSSFRLNVSYFGKIDRRNLPGSFLRTSPGLKILAFNATPADDSGAADQYHSERCVDNSIHVLSNHSIVIPTAWLSLTSGCPVAANLCEGNSRVVRTFEAMKNFDLVVRDHSDDRPSDDLHNRMNAYAYHITPHADSFILRVSRCASR